MNNSFKNIYYDFLIHKMRLKEDDDGLLYLTNGKGLEWYLGENPAFHKEDLLLERSYIYRKTYYEYQKNYYY